MVIKSVFLLRQMPPLLGLIPHKILSWLEEYSSDEIKQAMERVVKEKRSRYKDPEESFERIGLYLRLMRATPEEQQFWILRAGLKKHFYNYQSEWKEMEMILKDLQKQNTFEDIKKFFDDFIQQNRTNDIKDLLSFIKSI
jgi:hypothetical protein